MTKKEIARLFGWTEFYIHQCFLKAVPTHEGLKQKQGHYSKMKAINYTFEECCYALSFGHYWNPMMKQYLKENFIDRPGMYHYREPERRLCKSAKDFLFFYGMFHGNYYVCNTCAYCVPRQMNHAGSKDHPFCNFYNVFLNKVKIDVYTQRCPTYEKTKAKPRLWEPGLPTNIDMYGNKQNTTLGIDRSKFISKRSHDGDPIILLTEQ